MPGSALLAFFACGDPPSGPQTCSAPGGCATGEPVSPVGTDCGDGDGDGVTACGGDCDDGESAVVPGAREVCNGVDDDCDGRLDEDDDSVDTYTCGYCPDPAGFGDAVFRKMTANACVLDPTVSFCSDDPARPDTHTAGQRLHRLVWRDDGAPLRDELLLFIPPGAGDHNERSLLWGAYAGYRVLDLGWQSDLLIRGCGTDARCYDEVHRELTYGEDASADVEVPPNDALVGRLDAVLRWLAEEHAADGFDRYWTQDEGIQWDRIVLWGWSVGATEAAYLSRFEAVDGLVLVSGPKEIVGPPFGPAPWIAEPPATLPCAQFGFYHLGEDRAEICDEMFGALGMTIPAVDADATASPFDGAQVLHTEASDYQQPWCNDHQAMAMDECMSDDLFEPYLYMFCRAGEIESCE